MNSYTYSKSVNNTVLLNGTEKTSDYKFSFNDACAMSLCQTTAPTVIGLYFTLFGGKLPDKFYRFIDTDGEISYKCLKSPEETERPCYDIHRALINTDELKPVYFGDFIKVYDDGLLYISTTYNGLLVAYCGNGDIEVAKEFLMSHTRKYEKDLEDSKIHYRLVRTSNFGFTTMDMIMDDMEVDTEKNYNDDFDYEKLKNLQLQESASLTLLHGSPGTGKTTILKKLIKDIGKEKSVYYMDCNALSSFSDGAFMDFIVDSLKDNVIILEDCEKALMDRNNSNNPIITTLLNMTDGFLASSLKTHFICTFNCPLSKIDKALLRKGRLSFRYEFRDLCVEKCKAINPLANKAMPLSELYNLEEEVCAQAQTSKIGFC